MEYRIFSISSQRMETFKTTDMKTINVPKIIPAGDLENIFATLPEHAIDCCNWPKERWFGQWNSKWCYC